MKVKLDIGDYLCDMHYGRPMLDSACKQERVKLVNVSVTSMPSDKAGQEMLKFLERIRYEQGSSTPYTNKMLMVIGQQTMHDVVRVTLMALADASYLWIVTVEIPE